MSDEQRRKISAAHTRTELPAQKRCPRCEETKPASAFRVRNPARFVLASYCLPCEKARSQAQVRAKRQTRRPRPTPMQRFMAKVIKDDSGCWLFTAGRKPNGYANFKAKSYTTVHAHRWSYEQHVGPIPEGLELDHLCRVRNCVNPEHLEPVTSSENFRRSSRWPDREAREARLLAWLADHPDSSAADVAVAIGGSAGAIRLLLKRLVVAGLVTDRRPAPRRVVFSLAPPENYEAQPKSA